MKHINKFFSKFNKADSKKISGSTTNIKLKEKSLKTIQGTLKDSLKEIVKLLKPTKNKKRPKRKRKKTKKNKINKKKKVRLIS